MKACHTSAQESCTRQENLVDQLKRFSFTSITFKCAQKVAQEIQHLQTSKFTQFNTRLLIFMINTTIINH